MRPASSADRMSRSDRITRWSLRGALALAHEAVHFALEGVDVFVRVIDRCKPNVGQLVDIAQGLGGQATDLLGGDLGLAMRSNGALDVVTCLFDPLEGDRALLERLEETRLQLPAVELLARAIAFQDRQPCSLGTLVRREPVGARLA